MKWSTAWASVIGKSHIENNLPCQDACSYKEYDDFTISIVSDGAGSCNLSEKGSNYCVNILQVLFEEMLDRNSFTKDTVSRIIWEAEARKTIIMCRNMLKELCETTGTPFRDLSCTIIVVVTFDDFILTAHVGDGRAGWLDYDNQWHSLITPHKGEEANQTFFITSEPLEQIIEARVFMNRAKAICLMSDGMEMYAYEVSKKKPDLEEWWDPNVPYGPFFEKNVSMLPKLVDQKGDLVNDLWANFLKAGNALISDEPDDKTLILSVRNETI